MNAAYSVLWLLSATVLSPFRISEKVTCNDSVINTGVYAGLSAEGTPDLYCDTPVYRFGKVYKYENIRHYFVIQNRGTQELKINKIETACGCIVGETSDTKIAPGMSGKIQVRFRTGPETGIVVKNIRIHSSDPDTPVYILKLSGEVIEDITVSPRQINFGSVSKGDHAYGVVNLQPRPEFHLEINDVVSSNSAVNVRYRKDEEKGNFLVNVILKGDAPVDVLLGNISIFTNSERQKRIIVPVYGEVLGDIRV